GHRGATHSLACAAAIGGGGAVIAPPCRWPGGIRGWVLYVAGCAASHGPLDACTHAGHGIAFFWPFSGERYLLPWQPSRAAPLGVRAFFTAHGWVVFRSELLWVWLPALTLALTAARLRRRRSGCRAGSA